MHSFLREGGRRQASRCAGFAAAFDEVSAHEKARRLMPAGLISCR